MLIEVMQRSLLSHMGSFPFDYEFRVLLRYDLLIQTEQRSSRGKHPEHVPYVPRELA